MRLRQKITRMGQGKTLKGVVISVIGDRVSVSVGDRVFRMVQLVGGPVERGAVVQLDTSSGKPVAMAVGTTTEIPIAPLPTRRVTGIDPDLGESIEPYTGVSDGTCWRGDWEGVGFPTVFNYDFSSPSQLEAFSQVGSITIETVTLMDGSSGHAALIDPADGTTDELHLSTEIPAGFEGLFSFEYELEVASADGFYYTHHPDGETSALSRTQGKYAWALYELNINNSPGVAQIHRWKYRDNPGTSWVGDPPFPGSWARIANIKLVGSTSPEGMAKDYFAGEVVRHNGDLWYCVVAISPNTNEPGVSEDWVKINDEGGTGSAHIILDESTALTQRSKLSFQGQGVTATDDSANDRTIVTIPGGGLGDGMENPMTTAGDLIVGGASGTPMRLAKGTDGQVLKMVAGSLAWDLDLTGGGAELPEGNMVYVGSWANEPEQVITFDSASDLDLFTHDAPGATIFADAPAGGPATKSIQFRPITHSQTTYFEKTITVSGGNFLLRFDYFVSSEQSYDFFRFNINTVQQFQASGTVLWTNRSQSLTPGVYTLRWIYMKDGSDTSGLDTARVTNIYIPSTAEQIIYQYGEVVLRDGSLYLCIAPTAVSDPLTDTTAWKKLGAGGGDGSENPMTTIGDLIIGGADGTPTRLPLGTSGKVLKSDGGNPYWGTDDTGVGGGTALYNTWDPLAPPASPHAMDDEFSATFDNAKWSVFNPVNEITVQTDRDQLLVNFTGVDAVSQIWGVHQALPAGDFTAYTMVSVDYPWGLANNAGIGLFQNADPTTGGIAILNNHTAGFNLQRYTVYTGTATLVGNGSSGSATQRVFLRLSRSGSTYGAEGSYDGLSWIRLNGGTLPFTPTRIGFAGQTANNIVLRYRFEFFRFAESILSGPVAGAFKAVY
jgi:hypothetical protein